MTTNQQDAEFYQWWQNNPALWKSPVSMWRAARAPLLADRDALEEDMAQEHKQTLDDFDSCREELSIARAEIEQARRTGEYWKAEHWAGNTKIAALETRLEVNPESQWDGIACRDETIRLLETELTGAQAKIAEFESQIATSKADALMEAGKKFVGEIGYNFVSADGYSNAWDIQSELMNMADDLTKEK